MSLLGASVTSKPVPKTQNVVATVNVGCELELRTIVTRSRNSEYNPRKFSAVIMRIREPKATALIFGSGKIVITGARSEEEARQAAKKLTRIIQKIGFAARFDDFKIQNVVGSADVGFPIRLEGFANRHSEKSSYEPELFPGLIYRMSEPRVVVLLFVSGKVVMTGAKSTANVRTAFDTIHPMLEHFRKEVDDLLFD